MAAVYRSRPVPAARLWALLGVGAGLAGLLATYAVEMIFTLHRPVMLVVASMARHAVPEHAHEVAVKYLGLNDRGFFIFLLVLAGCVVMALGGSLARVRRWRGVVAPTLLGAVAVVAVATQSSGQWEYYVPIGVGWVVTLAVLCGVGRLLTDHLAARQALAPGACGDPADGPNPPGQPQSSVVGPSDAGPSVVGPCDGRRPGSVSGPVTGVDPHAAQRAAATRRTLLATVVTLTVAGGVAGVAGRRIGNHRRRVASARTLVRLPEMTRGRVPTGAHSPVLGAPPWRTSNADFFVKDTVLRTPTVDPDRWLLRVHGLVSRELELSYADLVRLPVTEQWTTLVCADNEPGGNHVGNAWWTGVRVADVLTWAGVDSAADLVVQTSEDGWQCRTPLEALMGEDALLAFGMNGEVLPTEHGFPVRTLVPGLVGDVSACKWVVDLHVTRQADLPAGHSVDEVVRVPTRARLDLVEVPATGAVRVSGTAWGADLRTVRVEVQVDEGRGRPVALLPEQAGSDTVPRHVWRQFTLDLDLAPGQHQLRARALTPGGPASRPHERGVKVPAPS